jgi:hypothetical protein
MTASLGVRLGPAGGLDVVVSRRLDNSGSVFKVPHEAKDLPLIFFG